MAYNVSIHDRATNEHLMWCGTFDAANPAEAKQMAAARQAQFPISTFAKAVKRDERDIVVRARKTSTQPSPWGRKTPAKVPVVGAQRWARTAGGQRIKVEILRVDGDRVVVEDQLRHQRATIATGQLLD